MNAKTVIHYTEDVSEMAEIERQTQLDFQNKLLDRLETIGEALIDTNEWLNEANDNLVEINKTLKNFGNFMTEPADAQKNPMRNDAYE